MLTAKRRRCRMIAVLVPCVCGAVAVPVQGAHAAPYAVWACADGSGQRQPAADWYLVRVSDQIARPSSSCGDSAAPPTARLFARATSNPNNDPLSAGTGWRVDAGPGTRITGLDIWWNGQVNPMPTRERGRITISAPHTIYNLEPTDPEAGASFGGAEATGPGSELVAYSERNHQAYRELSSSTASIMAWCTAYCREDVLGLIGYYAVYRVRTIVDDVAPPTGTAVGLADGARIVGPIDVQTTAADVGSGVREITLRVDDRVVDRSVSGGDCTDIDLTNGEPYEYNRMSPCPLERSAQLTLSPAELLDGARHDVSVVVTDAAGQETVIGTARVGLAAPPGFFANARFFNPDLDVVSARRLNGMNAGPGTMRLSFVVGRGKHKRLVPRRLVAAGGQAVINGRLINAHGLPIAGARIWRASSSAAGSWQISGRPLTTSSTGRVTGRLPARMPSRDVRLIYFPYSDSSETVQSPSRRLRVRAATTMHAEQSGYRNGDTMRLSGRITTRPIARRQALYLQVIVRGRWRTFDTTRADARGRWKLNYRFTATRQLTMYRFRAVVPASEQPVAWATGYSRPLRVIVTP